ncbi:hypothetical protein FRUB_06082 [Fimbriiglobus ruber]|uniref:Uncharacterized protein n=1 Tax=Fimbriiglobus ruber TaxID=1908690 RepID=A0A225DQT8_9BACT|nr:hypothetical protein FRUB_06082 [Fimbriiglobus ruber]
MEPFEWIAKLENALSVPMSKHSDVMLPAHALALGHLLAALDDA